MMKREGKIFYKKQAHHEDESLKTRQGGKEREGGGLRKNYPAEAGYLKSREKLFGAISRGRSGMHLRTASPVSLKYHIAWGELGGMG